MLIKHQFQMMKVNLIQKNGKFMKCILTFILCVVFVGCGHANNKSQQLREDEISQALASRILAIGDDIAQSRKLYISAYKTISNKSEMNNELLVYTVRKIDSLIANYEVDNDSFENDIIVNKKITIEAIDGLCIMNKFIEKYLTLIDLNKVPIDFQGDIQRVLKYQSNYTKRLSEDKDHLNQLNCLSLK